MAHIRGYKTFGGWPGKIGCPRLEELEKTFFKSGGTIKKLKASELFTVKGNPQLNKDSFIFSKDSQYPYFTRTVINNGILGYVDYLDEDHKISGNCLSVGMLGMKFFYMDRDFYAGQFTKSVYPKFEGFDEDIAQWFISWFNKSSNKFLSVLVRDFEKVFNDTDIDVPYKNGEICISYIKHIIEELKTHETKKLNHFFDSNGYSDCSLTVEELHSLELFASNNVQMEEKAIKESFSIENGKRLTKSNMIPGNTNFIGASATENGITNRISNNKHLHSGNLITVTYNGSVGESFYQPFPFWASDDVNVLYPIEKLSESQCLYFLAPLRKKGNKYGYTFKWTKEIMEQDSICVPVKSDGSIDYDLMETYINALKKLCIARLETSNIFTHDIFETMQIDKKGEEANNNLVHNTSAVPDTDRFTRYLPLYSVKAACGPHEHNFSDEGLDNVLGWIDASKLNHKLNENMFVVQAVGHSMEPNINDGDYCVFERYSPSNAGSREGKIVLAKDITEFDDDYSGSFTIKQYHRVSASKVELRSINKGHPTFTIEPNEEYEHNNPIIAVFVDKL